MVSGHQHGAGISILPFVPETLKLPPIFEEIELEKVATSPGEYSSTPET